MADGQSSWRLFAVLLRPHRRTVVQYATFLAMSTCLPLVAAVVLQRFVDAAVRRDPTRDLVALAGSYAGIGLLGSVVAVLVVWRSNILAWKITDGLRHDLAEQVLNADLAFHRDHTRGDLVSRADDDVTAMAQFFSQFVARAIGILALAFAATLTLAIIRPLLAPPFLLCMLTILGMLWAQRNIGLLPAMEERDAKASVSSLIEERIGGSEDVRSLGAGHYSVNLLAERSERLVQAVGHRTRAQMRLIGTVKVSLVCSEVVMLLWGAHLLSRDLVTIGTIVLGVRFVSAIRGPVEQLSWRLQEIQGATGSATRVMELRAAQRMHPERTSHLPNGPLDLVFRNVSLTYDDGSSPVLSDLTLRVPAGRSLGLVGRSGSGKTSIGRLLLRLIEPTQGSVLVGGVDLRGIDETSFRQRITSVPQDVQLFPGTVRDNVTMFTETSDDEVKNALRAVGLEPWLADQAQGLDSALLARKGGVGLSAGEAQLLALARALVRSPSVVVLDEATSRIDPATQALISEATASLLKGRTSVVIAHRLETLSVCDYIAVLHQGEVIEHGLRTDLAANPDSRFARLLLASQAGHDDASQTGHEDLRNDDDLRNEFND